LLKKQRPVKIVALDLGFKQLSHFSREFKRRYGLSPTAYVIANNPPSPLGHSALHQIPPDGRPG
jgi:AraC-like DNA-binding protein